MKKVSPNKRISREKVGFVASDNTNVIRQATSMTLVDFSKTFSDLAAYDRTEKTSD